MDKITPCLWFDGQAEEAAQFYVSVFPNSKIGQISHVSDAGPGKPGSVLTVTFELDGRLFMGLNGGPYFKFNEAVSFSVDCADQAEVDFYWETLSAGGETSQCGWLKDRFGVSWQIVPRRLPELMADPDAAKVRRVTEAMLQMTKLDIAKLEAAAAA
ncbi:VOC family protein [Tepidicaulis sp. LMO-SS28]|uniref:VOC family protein n=1 Tax=Tepidicaulis sp. LMO-SS28 TaxID=3447455 RepID=UPI003EDFC468